MKIDFVFSLAIVAVALAVLLGFSTFDTARAVPGIGDEGYGWLPPDQVNLFGFDGAHNSAGVSVRDRDIGISEDYMGFPDTYHP